MASYTDIFGGSPVQTADDSYAAINLNVANIFLAWPTQFQDTNLAVAKIMDVTPDQAGRSITLPDATKVSVGTDFLIVNVGNFNFSLAKNDNTLLATVEDGTSIYFYLTDNTTVGGAWMAVPFGGGVAAVLSVTGTVPTASDAANLTINGGNNTGALTGAVGLAFGLAGDLAALTRFAGGTGIAVRTAANTWALRSIVTPVVPLAGNIVVTNPNGVADNISIDLIANIGVAGINNLINSISAGNIGIGAIPATGNTANTISTTNNNGNLVLAPNGTGITQTARPLSITGGAALSFVNNGNTVSFAAPAGLGYNLDYLWPAVLPTAGQALTYAGGGVLSWQGVPTVPAITTINHIARFNNAGGQLKDSLVILGDDASLSNISSVTMTGPLSVGTLQIAAAPGGAASIASTAVFPIVIQPGGGQPFQVSNGAAAFFQASNTGVVIGSAANPSLSLSFATANGNVSLIAPTTNTVAINLTLPAVRAGFDNAILVGSTAAAGALSFSTTLAGVAAQRDDMTHIPPSTTLPVVPAVVQYHPGVAKARGSFSAIGVLGQDSYNINNAITYTNPGIYAISFVNNMENQYYQVVATVNGAAGFVSVTINAANQFTINTYDAAGAAANLAVSFVVFGTQ